MMHQSFYRAVSLVVTLAMLATLLCRGILPAAAAENSSYTLYFENSDRWEQVYVYYWSDENTSMVAWPGEPTVIDEEQLACAQVPGDARYVIFNNQGQGKQTPDLTIPGTEYIYSQEKQAWYPHVDCEHSWKETLISDSSCSEPGIKEYICQICNADYRVKLPTLPHNYENGLCRDCGKEKPATQTVYFELNEEWAEVNAYYWCMTAQEEEIPWPTWPGVPMTAVNDRLYSIKIPAAAEYIIFNSGSVQTEDLAIPGPNQVYSYTTGQWKELSSCEHQYDELVLWPLTCTENGVSLFSCRLCGDTYEQYHYATGHDFAGGSCTKCGETEPSDVTVYFDNANNWEQVYVYFWADGNISLSAWPGVEMTALEAGYTAQISGEAEYVIFNNGDGLEQSPDMWLPGDSYLFSMFTMEWSAFTGCFHTWQQTESITPPNCIDSGFETYACVSCGVSCSKHIPALGHSFENGICINCGADASTRTTLYFDNAESWETVYVYFWSADDIGMTQWPGLEMTAADGGYCADIPATAQYVIFNDGTNQNQTSDMHIPGSGWLYSLFTEDWSAFNGCFHHWQWGSWTFEPDCVNSGFGLYICSDCNATCGHSASALGHDYADGVCQRCGEDEPEMNTVYFDNSDGWANVYVYYWPDMDADYHPNWYFPEWPGVQMTHVEGTIYKVDIPVYGTELSFSDGGNVISNDLTVPGDEYLYRWKLGVWTKMTTSQGVTVQGTITSFLDADEEITLTLTDAAGNTAVTETVHTYTFTDVTSGTYTLTVSKSGHGTLSYRITVGAEDLSLDVKICPMGDVTGDGRVNVADTSKVYSHVKGTALLTDYAFTCADVDSNGKLNVADTSKVYSHVKGSKLLW